MLFILLVLFIISLYSPIALAGDSAAVLDFGGDVRSEYRSAATNYLTQLLIDLDRMDIISRSEMERVMEEQRLQLSGLVDGDAAEQAGSILGVERLFVGNIDRLSVERSDGDYNGEARITVQLVDVRTGTILNSFAAEGSSYSKGNRTAARNEALESAINDLRNPIREAFAITSFVINVTDDYVDLMGGTGMGIRDAHRYHVVRTDESGFGERIGMIEIEQVNIDASRGKIIWQEEPIEEGDIAEEIPYNFHSMTSIGFSSKTLSYGDDSQLVSMLEFRGIMERTFAHEAAAVFSLGYGEGVTFFRGGLEGSYEVPINQAKLHLVGTAGASFIGAWQSHPAYRISSWRSYSSGTAIGSGFYGNLGAGIKYYSNYEDGLRVRIGVDGRLGSTISSWESSNDHNVTDLVDHSEVGLSGIGFNVNVSIPVTFFSF